MDLRKEEMKKDNRQKCSYMQGLLHGKKFFLIAILEVLFTLNEVRERNEGQELNGYKSK